MSKEDLMKDVRLPDDFRSDLFAPVINPTVKQEKKEEKPEEKPVEKVEEVSKVPAEEEKPVAKKPATTKSAAKTKKSPAATKKSAQEPISEDEEEFIKMTYLLPLRQVEAIRLISFNEGRMNYEVLRDILDDAIPNDIMEDAKLRVKNGIAKASRRKK